MNRPACRTCCIFLIFAMLLLTGLDQAMSQVAGTATAQAPEISAVKAELPLKVLRYVMRLIAKYDADGDGSLQREEWEMMSGAPQAIDIDADGTIDSREMMYHVADYGLNFRNRSLLTLPVGEPEDVRQEGLSVFRPITPLESLIPGGVAVSEGEATASDDIDSVRTAADTLIEGTTRIYTKPTAELQGLPDWFRFMDTNGDGQVTTIEFTPELSTPRLRQFGMMDKNGDGILSPAECR